MLWCIVHCVNRHAWDHDVVSLELSLHLCCVARSAYIPWSIRIVCLGSGRASPLHGHRARGTGPLPSPWSVNISCACFIIIFWLFPAVYTFHVITLVPSSWKAVVMASSLASREFAEVWVDSVVVHSVHLTFMTEQTRIGRKAKAPAVLILGSMFARIGLQV